MEIKITNLTFIYKDNLILKDISFSFTDKDYIALIGRNGSGKSTLIKILSGILNYTNGFIGQKIKTHNNLYFYKKLKHKEIRFGFIGIIFQKPDNQIVNSIVENDIAFGLENNLYKHNEMHSIVDNILNFLNISRLKKRDVNTLSGGEKQLIAIASMLVLKYKFLLFDEVTSMLDIKNTNFVVDKIKYLHSQNNCGIIFVTHKLHLLKYAEKTLILDQGEKVFFDKTIKITEDLLNKFKLN
ncbi:energy-coupling factor ABC transporter ATP-binding protein [Candidatus Hepatoplasma crinochetorum]|uniref:energy-coupling factor ABC transporter ATP-binding protein n=1 Tax=Candidatus Hepatoplasma crinochetorum TaxID=295596 RepID=UPI003092A00B|nr:MAG: energy-coupling factor transporter ATP-binding protein EcfA1 [Candidatus Hepatoplasma crinochetorum]